jgi:hypothetical protein
LKLTMKSKILFFNYQLTNKLIIASHHQQKSTRNDVAEECEDIFILKTIYDNQQRNN